MIVLSLFGEITYTPLLSTDNNNKSDINIKVDIIVIDVKRVQLDCSFCFISVINEEELNRREYGSKFKNNHGVITLWNS